MAEACREENLSDSVLAGSEPVFEQVCDLCAEDGQNLEAQGFCQGCNDFLCGDCLKHHRKSRYTKNHTVLDKEYMPRQKPESGKQDRAEENYVDMCPNHSDEFIKYFCGDHGELGCSACMTVKHRTCEDVNYIKDITAGLGKSGEFDSLTKKLGSFIDDTQRVIRNTKSALMDAEDDNTKTISKIRDHADKTVSLVRKSEEIAIKQSERLKVENVQHLTYALDSFRSAVQSAERTNITIEGLKKDKKNCQLFIAMKKGSTELSTLQQEHVKIKQDVRVRRQNFKPNDDICRSVDALGKLSTDEILIYRTVNPMNMTATHLSTMNVHLDTNTGDCYITGIVLLPGGRLVLTDYHNSKVKLVDTSGKLRSELQIQGSSTWDVWDVTKVNDDSLACTLVDQQKILLLKVADDRLRMDREIRVDGNCRGIDHRKGQFAVSFQVPNKKVEIIDIYGRVLREVTLDDKTFKNPLFVNFSRDGQSLYISDYGNHQVTILTVTGKVKATYTDKYFSPHNMFVDDQGFLYVCDRHDGNVRVLSPDIEKAMVILPLGRGPKAPLCVVNCDDENKLYVAGDDQNLYTYQLS